MTVRAKKSNVGEAECPATSWLAIIKVQGVRENEADTRPLAETGAVFLSLDLTST